jgi:hypothetical protein
VYIVLALIPKLVKTAVVEAVKEGIIVLVIFLINSTFGLVSPTLSPEENKGTREDSSFFEN